ncbi:MAG: branched-chain amino acid ABC transporter permease, partial [Rhizobiales bacterium]|nr:branched-chain amino acid ABC transporter permease [Hyphomicrobiales bacterium]
MAQIAETTRINGRRHIARGEVIAFLAMVAILLVAPMVVYPVSIMKALCFALFACAFNLLIGYVGLLSFGHALYFGYGAYVSAHLAKVGAISLPYWSSGWQWFVIPLPPLPPELAILGGTVAGGVLGLVAGSIAIRRQGIYFAMITLALAQMMYFFAVQAPFTHGEDGIQAVPRDWLFGIFNLADQRAIYGTVLVIFLAGFLFIYRVIHSP